MPGEVKNRWSRCGSRSRKNDNVKVISGRDKGKTGRVLDVDRRTGKIWSST